MSPLKEAIAKDLQKAAEQLGEPLSSYDYQLHASRLGLISHMTVYQEFENWEAACEYAGIKCNPSRGPQKRAYTLDQCLEAVKEWRMQLPETDRETYESYVQWARENKRPSGPTVRNKTGSWKEAKRRAFGA